MPDCCMFCSGAACGKGFEGVGRTHFYEASSRLSYSLNSLQGAHIYRGYIRGLITIWAYFWFCGWGGGRGGGGLIFGGEDS